MNIILELVIVGLVGLLVGILVTEHFYEADIKEFQREAVLYECGFWNVNGDFDWKSPELTMIEPKIESRRDNLKELNDE